MTKEQITENYLKREKSDVINNFEKELYMIEFKEIWDEIVNSKK